MVNLDKKIFGNITIKEIIGAEPSIENIQTLLENELKILLNNLKSSDSKSLQKLLELQIESEKIVNSRPGAMALPQNKIKTYVEINQKLIQAINKKLEF